MKKIALFVCLVFVLSIIAGCDAVVDKAVEKGVEKTVEKKTGTKIDVDDDGDEVTMEFKDDDGKTGSINMKEGADGWCQEGGEWSMASGDDSTEWVVEGIMGSGKYKGYCHVIYTIKGDGDNMRIDYYFDEDENGYQIMNVNGEKIEMSYKSS